MTNKITIEELRLKMEAKEYEDLYSLKEADITYNRKNTMEKNEVKKYLSTLSNSKSRAALMNDDDIFKPVNKHKDEFINDSVNKPIDENKNDSINENKDEHINDSVDENKDESNYEDKDINKLIAEAKKVKAPKPTKYRDTHVQRTFWVESDVMKLVDALCTNKGDKAKFISTALLNHAKSILEQKQ